ncbi:hypothetical protein ACFJIS_21250 [Variovorax boronicumulans]|uniref:hypothetical protein n=1 Tax=Variovorax boronicumulans TaxID=436515 RepID=UPI0036F4020B
MLQAVSEIAHVSGGGMSCTARCPPRPRTGGEVRPRTRAAMPRYRTRFPRRSSRCAAASWAAR